MSANEVVRQANGYDTVAARVQLRCKDESLAVQSQREEADINVLVRRFRITGQIPVRKLPEAIVGHAEEFDLMNAHAVLMAARESFMSLDAEIRARFDNDPVRFVSFAEKPENLDELRKLGLAKPVVEPVAEKVQKVEIVERVHGEEGRGDSGSTRGARGTRKADRSES